MQKLIDAQELKQAFMLYGVLIFSHTDVDFVTKALKIVNSQPEAVTRCKDCKHRPKIAENPFCKDGGFVYEFPDNLCPCQCKDDPYYSWMPEDDWYCGNAERKKE